MAYLKLVVAAIVVVVASSVAGQPIPVEETHYQDENLQPFMLVDSSDRRPIHYRPGKVGTSLSEPFMLVDSSDRRDTSHGPPVHKPKKHYTPGKVRPSLSEPIMLGDSSDRRDTSYGPPAHKPKKHYTPGRVGPVYTFVKTDYHGNFKWGVRHRAGAKYAGSYN